MHRVDFLPTNNPTRSFSWVCVRVTTPTLVSESPRHSHFPQWGEFRRILQLQRTPTDVDVDL